MTISTLLSPGCIFIDTDISSKKRLLEFISNTVADQFDLPQSKIYGNLLDRERLGSTGLGNGFAIPHARLSNLDTTIGCFIRLVQPVKFEAPDNKPVDLTAKEFDLLLHFARNPGRVYRRAELLDSVWGYGHEGYEHTVNSHINRLRSKIEPDATKPEYIVTVWGVGYKLTSPGTGPVPT